MAVVSASYSGLINDSPSKLQWRIQRPVNPKIVSFNATPVQSVKSWVQFWKIPKTRIRFCGSKQFGVCASAGGNQNQIRAEGDEIPEKSFWITVCKDIYWSLKWVIGLLMAPPGMLKYIEFPANQNMLRTVTLLLLLVALLAVLLASMNSAPSFLLALILKKSA